LAVIGKATIKKKPEAKVDSEKVDSPDQIPSDEYK